MQKKEVSFILNKVITVDMLRLSSENNVWNRWTNILLTEMLSEEFITFTEE